MSFRNLCVQIRKDGHRDRRTNNDFISIDLYMYIINLSRWTILNFAKSLYVIDITHIYGQFVEEIILCQEVGAVIILFLIMEAMIAKETSGKTKTALEEDS